jgi:putative 4-mercaptohistidine N1-methyltranferase
MKRAAGGGAPYYESDDALEQYLFFHYGAVADYLPFPGSPRTAFGYPARVVKELVDRRKLVRSPRALDLGCAVGRTSFELSRWCGEVVGIDLSRAFIRAARRMQRAGDLRIRYAIEGERRGEALLRRPAGARPERVRFAEGDAMALSPRLGRFDLAVLVNLIDRVPDPAACLQTLAGRLNPGAQLVIASPYTWLEEYTPRERWLGGREGQASFTALAEALGPRFRLLRRKQIPFILREHARKYQWSIAEGTSWQLVK